MSEELSSERRHTRLHESRKRRRMKIKVIFNPYWILATYYSELNCMEGGYDGRSGNEVEEMTTPGEWKREDEEAEHCHFKHEERKDLRRVS
jgi:hypothetical protein